MPEHGANGEILLPGFTHQVNVTDDHQNRNLMSEAQNNIPSY